MAETSKAPTARRWAQSDLDVSVIEPGGERKRVSFTPKAGLYPCGRCSKGWTFGEDERGYSRAKPCGCNGVLRLAERMSAIRLPPKMATATVDQWKANGERPVPDEIRAWADAFAPKVRGRLVLGSNGIGKSWIVAVIARLVAERGFTVRWCKWSELLDDLKANMNAEEPRPEHEITGPLLSCQLLVVDELGGGTQRTEWANCAIERVLGARLENEDTTFITSNAASSDDLDATVGARVYSRILTLDTLRMSGRDMRRDR